MKEEITIEKLEELASDKTLSKNELSSLYNFWREIIIPAKKNQVAQKEASNYIEPHNPHLLSPKCRCKALAFWTKKAKKKNPSYVAEIEDSEDRHRKPQKS